MKSFVITCLLLQLTFGHLLEATKYPELNSGYFEGDIILGSNQRNGLLDENRRWPEGVVPVDVDYDFSDEEKAMINEAFEIFYKYTCVWFVKRFDHHEDFVFIEKVKEGCSANVGRQGRRQYVKLSSDCFQQIGTILHELMHAIGFVHEHSRTDRDDYVEIKWDNILDQELDSFAKYDNKTVTDLGLQYDYFSVMHYGPYSFSKNSEPTIVAKDESANEIIGQRLFFSNGDIAKIKAMYKCKKP